MGLVISKYDAPFEYFPQIRPFKQTCELLRFSDSEVGRFYKLFKSIDSNDSESVDITELCCHLRVEKTRFNRRLFGLMDYDGSGELNFEEFMVGIWNYCSLSDNMFEHFAFELYDIDHSGNIDMSEANLMVKDMYGEDLEHNFHAKLALQKLHELDVNCLEFPAFFDFVRAHKAMLYPAYSLQLNVKKYFLGKSFWKRQARNRRLMSNGQYKSVVDILGRGWKRDSTVYTRFTGSMAGYKSGKRRHSKPTVLEGEVRRGSETSSNGDRRGSNCSQNGDRRGSNCSQNGDRRGSNCSQNGDRRPSNASQSDKRRGSTSSQCNDKRRGSRTTQSFFPESSDSEDDSSVESVADDLKKKKCKKVEKGKQSFPVINEGRRSSKPNALEGVAQRTRKGSKIAPLDASLSSKKLIKNPSYRKRV